MAYFNWSRECENLESVTADDYLQTAYWSEKVDHRLFTHSKPVSKPVGHWRETVYPKNMNPFNSSIGSYLVRAILVDH